MSSALNDQQLADAFPAAQSGQAWALRAVYETLSPRVAAYLRARGASEPEDLTSEVFLTVFSRLATITGGAGGLRTFVFSVAHARLVDDLRKQGRRRPTVELRPEQHARTVASSEDTALGQQETVRVQKLLDTLVPAQRDVLTLRVIADLTVEQIAETLGKSPGAVKQLQRRGLTALRRALAAGVETSRSKVNGGVPQ